ncbi:hypothetical protein [Xanthomonas euvesicatoria]|uniref:hypothetical protein n=1 Tax=Xanthomonas euvesicatoria TaxID=456327 RepID=UPI001C488E40|nr:hypothetical protein [Xanthomonas euvesicatoria]MBV6885835.1 hypothetical protein [Xanthomonas campestris pv. euphorbiae]
MAKRTKQPAQAGQDWGEPAVELLAELAGERYEAIIWKLNGGTNGRPPRRQGQGGQGRQVERQGKRRGVRARSCIDGYDDAQQRRES